MREKRSWTELGGIFFCVKLNKALPFEMSSLSLSSFFALLRNNAFAWHLDYSKALLPCLLGHTLKCLKVSVIRDPVSPMIFHPHSISSGYGRGKFGEEISPEEALMVPPHRAAPVEKVNINSI
jgi:hypothetical protein